MIKRAVLALVAVIVASGVEATQTTIVCRNPRREHFVTYDPASKVIVDQAEGASAAYRVTRTIKVTNGTRVIAKAVTRGQPDLTMTFGIPSTVTYSMNGRPFQSESCR